jgi:hypothetical protein
MKAILFILTLAAASLLRGGDSPPAAGRATDDQVIEREIPAAELRRMVEAWSHDGTTVLSVSARPDGSLVARVRPATSPDGSASAVPYDDRQVARVRPGETTEAQLLEWFGRPDSRDLKSDGRASLTWGLAPRTESEAGDSGRLSVFLGPDGIVAGCAAFRLPAREERTIEFVQQSEADLEARQAEWAREGWNVVSLSDATSQPDGTVQRKAVLSRQKNTGSVGVPYDDRQIAKIRRGETSETELLEWFGRPERREIKPDGQTQLAWSFASRFEPGSGSSGRLDVNLTPDGKVAAYAASKGPQ